MTAIKTSNLSLEEALDIAKSQMSTGNFNASAMVLIDILNRCPENFDAKHLLGISKFYLGEVDVAIELLEQAVSLPDANAESFCNLGVFLAQKGEMEKAIDVFLKAIDITPDKPDPYWNLSNAYLAIGYFENAKEYAKKALEYAPNSVEALLNLGVAQLNLADINAAIESWEKALEVQADYLPALTNLSDAYRSKKWLNKAKKTAEKIVAIEPENVNGIHNLASIYFDLGDFDASERAYKKAISIAPEFARAHMNLSKCYLMQKKFDQALESIKYAMLFDDKNPEVHFVKMDVLFAMGRPADALEAAQKATIKFPESNDIKMMQARILIAVENALEASFVLGQVDQDNANPQQLIHLSNLYERASDLSAALSAAQKASDKHPDLVQAYIREGQVHHLLGDIENAEKAFLKAIGIEPRNEAALLCLAEMEQSRGDLKKSLEYAKQVLSINVKSASAYGLMSKIKTFRAMDPVFEQMIEFEAGLSDDDAILKSEINFALFKAYDDFGDVDKAFNALEQANRYAGRYVDDVMPRQAAVHDFMRTSYLSQQGHDFSQAGFDSDIPVFIVGMSRSGTTFTEQILGMHPDVYAAGELLLFGLAEKEYGGVVTPSTAKNIGETYVKSIQDLAPDGQPVKRITNKTPANYLNIGNILRSLPNAKIINCVRNPIDTCFSCYKQNFLMGHAWSYDLNAAMHQYNLYHDLMNFWKEVYPDRIYDVKYEGLVTDFESTVKGLVDHLDLEWDDACLRPQDLNRPIFTASKMQANKPVYSSSIGAWKKYKDHLRPLVEAFDQEGE